jgi:hypothetical protein
LTATLDGGWFRSVNEGTSPEKRRHPRRTLAVEFKAREADGPGTLELSGMDLSAGGAFLVCQVLLEPGETLSLEFVVPGRPAPVETAARVAWVRRFPSGELPAGMGIEFLGLSLEEQASLETLVAARA